ncbi:MAG: hypothetical protein LBS85_07355 [Clostridiales Family XIII bacterium]|jgi:hypothetical protein|nr:hypothetical protein [Clostridiales Family XIII bacterium]
MFGHGKSRSAATAAVVCIVTFAVILTGTRALKIDFGESQLQAPAVNLAETEQEVPLSAVRVENVSIIGDSITLGASSRLTEAIPDAYIDAEVGRDMSIGFSIFKKLIDKDELGSFVVIALANNVHADTITNAKEIIDLIGSGRRLVFVTGHGLTNMEPVNEYIRDLPDQYPFITVADWDVAITPHEDLLGADHIHVNKSEANQIYADCVKEALETAAAKPPSE